MWRLLGGGAVFFLITVGILLLAFVSELLFIFVCRWTFGEVGWKAEIACLQLSPLSWVERW